MNPMGRPSRFSSRYFQAGFTLVELMVGLAIGMLATVVIIQVISVFDAQRRTTTGSADAQTNGGIALHTIGREAQMAGYPLFPAADSPMECTTLTFGATGVTSINPFTITDGVAAAGVSASDTITIRYGSSPMGGVPSPITAMAGNVVTIGSNLGCNVNDITLSAWEPPAQCRAQPLCRQWASHLSLLRCRMPLPPPPAPTLPAWAPGMRLVMR